MLVFWLSNREPKVVNIRMYWNKPFDILFEMGQEKKWGTAIYELRTLFMNASLNNHLKQLRLAISA